MQFNIPQFIDVEDRIVGPLTLKQFFFLAGAAAILGFVWYRFKLWVFILVAVPVGSFALALAFVKINGRPFYHYLIAAINYFKKPKIYVWRKH